MATSTPSRDAEGAAVRGRRRSRVVRSFFGNPAACIALAFLVGLVVAAILAPALARFDPDEQHLADRLQGIGSSHWLGTDALGRDTLSRVLYGGRVTLVAAAQSVGIAIVLGVPLGLVAGYAGRVADAVLNTIADAFMSLPPLILALAIVGILGAGLTNAMIAVGIIFAPRFFRVARAAAQSIRHETYIEASRAVGCTQRRILGRHVLPNASGPLLVQVSFAVGLAIIAEASLSFLGLGVQDPTSSWGSMVKDAFASIDESSFSIYPPSVFIAATILAFSVVGDALRDALGRDVTDR